MTNLFRSLIVLSIFLMAVCALLPFEKPLRAVVPLDQPPPPWIFAALLLMLAAAAVVSAAVGLLRFRRWGRALGAAATAMAVVALGVLLSARLDVALGMPFMALCTLAGLAWLAGLLLTWHPRLAPRFGA